ncbi:beta-L-arabinofuranosidase domain-containing protein [Aeoliella mucimassa]|uniref:Autotransporter-associated beta strand repeat protein n=1 Tax=Aeoliella mucimassa TaxID=2527972 RepID=A0A518AR55_9BACT|nr:beta-L-arabinofuranosidase domain-containing protein [Aeoliella mucimassa]QDU57204.1 Autotransporter-associated beta strand repeat protein [Aeoliella mucimassa]
MRLRVALVLLVMIGFSQVVAAQSVDPFAAGTVQLLDGSYYKQMQDLQEGPTGYLSFFAPDDLLYEFRQQAGLPQPAGALDLEGRWEGDANEFGFVRGHTTGHYLSAASRMAALTGNQTYLDHVDQVVSGLAEVQDAMNDNGYLSAFPSTLFDRLENNQLSFPDAWVPYYTVHKVLAGLNDAHTYTGNQQALEVAFELSDYFVDRVDGLPQNVVNQMVTSHVNSGREFGGMNELLTDLTVKASDARDPRATSYLELADVFNNRSLMNELAAGNDVLNGIHANTHIPQAVGWARYGQIAGDQDATDAAVNFWSIVVRDHTFATGGNSYGEYFRTPGQETGAGGALLSWNTAETCNVYNMLKLSEQLFAASPEYKYAAYSENALINHILPSIDPHEGVTTYFMSLEPGHFKTYHTGHVHDGSFWCCAGTGMENPTRYAAMAFFKNANSLFVNSFMPAQVDWQEKGITLTQYGDATTADETMRMVVSSDGLTQANLQVAIPSYAFGDVTVTINGQAYEGPVNRGEYLSLDREWQDGDEIEVSFDKRLYLRRSRDDPDMVSVYYGAVLLAGELGTAGLPGGDQQALHDWDFSGVSDPSVPAIDASDADPETWLVPVEGEELHFELYDDGQATGIIFKPMYETHHERYSVYWQLNAPQATRTWRGGGMNTFQEGTNWDLAPTAGDSLAFAGSLTTTVDNNYAADTEFEHLSFLSDAAAFTLAGNRLQLSGNITNLSTNTQTIEADLRFTSGTHTIDAHEGAIVIGGNISGDATLVKTGAQRVTLLGTNTHSATVVSQGELAIGNGGTTGSLGTGSVVLENNASLLLNRSDETSLATSISGEGNLVKQGSGTLTVLREQSYQGQTVVEAGTLQLGTNSIGQGAFSLDFTQAGGLVNDANGQGTGFTRRLAGTTSAANDPRLALDTNAGVLEITSGGPADFNGDINLQNIEAPGVNLSDLGLSGDSDFTITASFLNSPDAQNYRQYGVFVGDSANRLVRGGYLTIDNHGAFGVNNAGGTPYDANLAYNAAGAPATGGELEVVLARIGGLFSLTVNGVNVTPTSQLSELNSLSDLTLGVFSLHTNSASGAFTVPLTSFTIQSPDLPGEISTGSLPSDTDVVVAAGATLDLNNLNQTIRSLAGEPGSQVLLGQAGGNTLTIAPQGAASLFQGTISGQGSLEIRGSGSQSLSGVQTYTGQTIVSSGTLSLVGNGSIASSSSIFIASGATLDTSGLTDAFIVASGQRLSLLGGGEVGGDTHIADGATLTGSGRIAGDLTLDSGATVMLTLQSPGVGDTLEITGALTLVDNVMLDVSLGDSIDSLEFRFGDSWQVLAFDTSVGEVSEIDWALPPLSADLAWDTSALLSTGVLAVGSGLAGDFNRDGVVNLGDYTVWRDHLGSPAGTLPSVGTLTGAIDHSHYQLWRDQFGRALPTSSVEQSHVPEPHSVLLTIIGIALLAVRAKHS